MNVEKALAYNKARGYLESFIGRVQSFLGVPETGEFNTDTVRAVARFQEDEGLDVDGMLGPKTKAALEAALRNTHDYEIGMWWDISSGSSVRNVGRYVARMQELGIANVAIMLTGASDSDRARWKWSAEGLEKFSRFLREGGVSVSLTFWPRPRRAYMQDLLEKLPAYIDAAEPIALEVDVEGNWIAAGVREYGSLSEAAEELVHQMTEWKNAYGLELGATSYMYHSEHDPKRATVTPSMDFITPQAYSKYREGKPGYGWSGRLGPGGFQRAAYKHAGRIKGPKIDMGLAAYGQEFPEHSAREAMSEALNSALALGVDRVWYWSAKWIMGGHETSYGAPFLRSLRGG